MRWILPLSMIFMGTLAGCEGQGPSEEAQADEKEEQTPTVQLVEVHPPRRGVIQDFITLSGDLKAEYSIDLTARVPGVVAAVPVRAGDPVKKGDLLLELEDDDLRIAARQEEGAYEQAVERARTAKLEHQEARQEEKSADIQVRRLDKELDRLEKLVQTATGALSLEEIEAKRFAAEEAKVSLETAALKTQRMEILTELSAVQVDAAKARWDRALLELSRTEIRSPIDGHVSLLDVRPGETVQSGSVVAAVVNRELLYTEVVVPQRRLPSIRVGQQVAIRAESYPGLIFPGVLESIHPTVDPQEGTIKARIAVTDPKGLLRPGIYVAARIVLDVHEAALLVPKRARLFEGGDAVVYVVRDGHAHRIPLSVGLQTETEFEVVEAQPSNGGGPDGTEHRQLRDDDLIVVRGQTHLKDGVVVRVHDPNTETEAEASESPEVEVEAPNAGGQPTAEKTADSRQTSSRP